MKQVKRKKRRAPITLVVLLVLLAVVSVQLVHVYGQLDSAKAQRETMSQELEQKKKENSSLESDLGKANDKEFIKAWPRISWALPRTASGYSMISITESHFCKGENT